MSWEYKENHKGLPAAATAASSGGKSRDNGVRGNQRRQKLVYIRVTNLIAELIMCVSSSKGAVPPAAAVNPGLLETFPEFLRK